MERKFRRFLAQFLLTIFAVGLLPVNAAAATIGFTKPFGKIETITQINPLYEGIVSEADLVKPSETSSGAETNATSTSDYSTTYAAAGEQLRAGLKQRQQTITVYYQSSSLDPNTDAPAIFSAATEHTGVPTEGDYLLWVWAGYTIEGSTYYVQNGVYYFTYLYTFTYHSTAAQEAELDTAVARLLEELNPTGSDYKKLCRVYDYICTNITYDYDSEGTLKHTAYAALIKGTAVCQGYAALLYRLALEMGIDCRLISGTGNGGDHGWNIVELNDLYYNVDSTWDAIWMQGVGKYNYFLQCEETFTEGGTDHIRASEYDTAAFHEAYPMSATDFNPDSETETEPTEPDAIGGTTGAVNWKLDEETGVLTIYGEGEIPDYANSTAQPWYAYLDQVTSLVIEEGITGIGMWAFCGYTSLQQVTLPESLQTVGTESFRSCTTLTEISIPTGVTEIGTLAFADSGLQVIRFLGDPPTMSDQIGCGAFLNVTAEVFYPADNEKWTSYVMLNYGGALTWVTNGFAPDYTAAYTTVSISLAGDIGVNYYAQLSDAVISDEGAYMAFTVAGQTQIVPLSEAVVSTGSDGITTYRFSCKVAAKQMTDTIVGQIYLSDGTAVGEAKAYSVKAYCDAAIPVYSQYPAYASLVDLMQAMLNYGAYSQVQFGYNTDALANAGLTGTTLPEITEAEVGAYAHGAEGSEEGISIASCSLLLESTTTIRFYFNVEDGYDISDYTFYVDGVETSPVESDGQYYVDKPNVAAKELDGMVTVTVGGLTAKYSGLSYVRQVAVLYPTYYSDALVNVVKALYAYNQAANAYFE